MTSTLKVCSPEAEAEAEAASAAGLRIGLFLGRAHLMHRSITDQVSKAASSGGYLAMRHRVPCIDTSIGLRWVRILLRLLP